MTIARLAPRDLSDYHEAVRRQAIQRRPLYWVARATIPPIVRVYFRLDRHGHRHIPHRGAVIIASNHRSFLDPFIVSACVHRPVYYVAKRELFRCRLQGWFLNRLGAFPVRRGESDEDSVTTARILLARGEALLIFPEGTRTRRAELGEPHIGVGRLALLTGAPVVPAVICGTDRVRRGWRVRPVKVRTWCSRPIGFERLDRVTSEAAREATAAIWRQVAELWSQTPPACRRETVA
jgi:1-acyl-sn-glycerol-3-phosphate acyltransferase